MIIEEVEYTLQTDSSFVCHLIFSLIIKILTLAVLRCLSHILVYI